MIARRNFIKKMAAFGGVTLSPMALYWPNERHLKQDIVRGGLNKIFAKYKNFNIFFEDDFFSFDEASFMSSFVDFYLSRRLKYSRPRALFEDVSRRLGHAPPFDAEAVCNCIREDFETEQLVIYKGWVFAEMEAQLCAMAKIS